MLPNARSSRPKQDHIDFDVRVNKETDTVLLYAEDAMIGQWDISAYTDKLKGNKMDICFVLSVANHPLPLSLVLVTDNYYF